jgi:5'-3' exonuclease
MCIRVCQRYYFNYVVAPYEADVQVGRREFAIAVTRDSDLIAYGSRQLLIVDSYNKQEWRFIDMTVPLTDEIKGKYPLYAHYKRWGIEVIHWWAAVMGCDITNPGDNKVFGIRGVGEVAFFKALESFELLGTTPNSQSLAITLLLRSKDKVAESYTAAEIIRAELDRVVKWFSKDGQFYDKDANLVSMSGAVLLDANAQTIQHSLGELNPKT